MKRPEPRRRLSMQMNGLLKISAKQIPRQESVMKFLQWAMLPSQSFSVASSIVPGRLRSSRLLISFFECPPCSAAELAVWKICPEAVSAWTPWGPGCRRRRNFRHLPAGYASLSHCSRLCRNTGSMTQVLSAAEMLPQVVNHALFPDGYGVEPFQQPGDFPEVALRRFVVPGHGRPVGDFSLFPFREVEEKQGPQDSRIPNLVRSHHERVEMVVHVIRMVQVVHGNDGELFLCQKFSENRAGALLPVGYRKNQAGTLSSPSVPACGRRV